MYRYTVMAVSSALIFVVVYILFDLILSDPIDWGEVLFVGIGFGVIMTVIQYYKERNKQ